MTNIRISELNTFTKKELIENQCEFLTSMSYYGEKSKTALFKDIQKGIQERTDVTIAIKYIAQVLKNFSY